MKKRPAFSGEQWLGEMDAGRHDRHTDAALIVGSAPSARTVADADIRNVRRIAINNAWRLRDDFDYLVCPIDFPDDRRAPPSYKATRIGPSEYMHGIQAAGGMIFCGATMAFAAAYWAIHVLRPRILGFVGCDMIYTPVGGQTHFYGTGSPDPLRHDVSLRDLEAKSVRLFWFGLRRGTLVVNCSTRQETRLVLPYTDLALLNDPLRALTFRAAMLSNSEVNRFRYQAVTVERLEQAAPFDARRPDYWVLDDGAMQSEYIDKVNLAWTQISSSVRRSNRSVSPAEQASHAATSQHEPSTI